MTYENCYCHMKSFYFGILSKCNCGRTEAQKLEWKWNCSWLVFFVFVFVLFCFHEEVYSRRLKSTLPLICMKNYPFLNNIFLASTHAFSLPRQSLVPVQLKSPKANKRLLLLATQLTGISVIPANQYLVIFHLKVQTECKHKRFRYQENFLVLCIQQRCVITDNSYTVLTVTFLQYRRCVNLISITLALLYTHSPFTKVCLSVGDDRASTRSFGQILSIRSCSIWKTTKTTT